MCGVVVRQGQGQCQRIRVAIALNKTGSHGVQRKVGNNKYKHYFSLIKGI